LALSGRIASTGSSVPGRDLTRSPGALLATFCPAKKTGTASGPGVGEALGSAVGASVGLAGLSVAVGCGEGVIGSVVTAGEHAARSKATATRGAMRRIGLP
jgi:hypothetical protein